jgi:signal transduction histidine kinase/ligand-binding sensor domain-containing protein/ActR/RegA family two-component response regulator
MPPHQRAHRVVALLFVAFGATGTPSAADPAPRLPLRDYVRRVWTTADGLPQNSVRAIVQSREGYLWLATSEGLTRFDGARLTVLDRQSLTSLPSPNISAIVLDRSGDMWIGFKRDGLARLRGDTLERWTRADGLPSHATTALVEDAGGTIWVCTDAGLARIPSTDRPRLEPIALPGGGGCGSLSSDRHGGVWAGHAGGATRISADARRTRTFVDGLPGKQVTALFSTSRGELWAGTDKGVARLEQGRWVPEIPALAGIYVTDLTDDSQGALWIATLSHGFARFADGTLEFGAATGQSPTAVLTLAEDREGTMWAGLSTGGLLQLRPTAFTALDASDGIPRDTVRAVLPARDGALWIGTAGAGLTRYHAGAVDTFTTEQGLPSNFVFGLVEDDRGRVWAGTRDGLAIATPSGVTPVSAAFPGAIRVLAFGRDGRLRVGTRDGVYVRLDSGAFERVPGTKGVIRALHEGRDGTWWVAGLAGLSRLRGTSVEHWAEDSGLPDSDLSDVHENPDGSVWVATLGQGLFRFDGQKVTRYTSAQGLFDDTIFQLVADPHGWLWMTSNRGLFRVKLADLQALAEGRRAHLASPSYGLADGLPAHEFNGGSTPGAALAPDGSLWFASIAGALRADPARLPDRPTAPRALVEAILLDGQRRSLREPLVVPPGPSRIEIHYTAQTLLGADRVRFRYRLRGLDESWDEAGVRRTAYYTNLPPGSYQFELMASRDGYTWSPPVSATPMTLQPSFHQTPLFAGLVGAVAAGMVFVSIRIRERRRAARERELEALVARRTRELEEEIGERRRAAQALEIARAQALQASELKSQFLANVSHEIRTPMNGVIGMTDLAMELPLPAEARRYLEVARSSADLLLHVINDVLDFSKIEACKFDLIPVEFDIRDELDEIVTLLEPQARGAGLSLSAATGDEVPASIVGDPARLRQVLLNLVGNAVKFTEQGGVRIEVGTIAPAPDEQTVRLSFAVIDSGVGIAPGDQARIFEAFTQVDGSSTRRFGGTGLGLAIAARLVALMGGVLDVHSVPGEGSRFSFTATFPRGRASTAAREEPAALPAAVPLSVLVAEDNPVNCLVVQRMLARRGHAVTVVGNGADAVECALTGRFDVVLMDVQMPEMNGLEATVRIRERESGGRLPIVGLTAHALRGDLERCLDAGMDHYLAKPIRRADLDRVLAAITPRDTVEAQRRPA